MNDKTRSERNSKKTDIAKRYKISDVVEMILWKLKKTIVPSEFLAMC